MPAYLPRVYSAQAFVIDASFHIEECMKILNSSPNIEWYGAAAVLDWCIKEALFKKLSICVEDHLSCEALKHTFYYPLETLLTSIMLEIDYHNLQTVLLSTRNPIHYFRKTHLLYLIAKKD